MSAQPKHVAVVGSGIIGASIAYHLAKADCRVTVVEAGESGGLATRQSFAWINASWGNREFYFHFRRRAMAEWSRLDAEIPGVFYRQCGGLLWDLPQDRLEAFAVEHLSWGYDIRQVGRDQALKIEPGLIAPPDFALHAPTEGAVEPVAAARAMLAAARIAPVKASVESLLATAGRVTGIATDIGTIQADEVVIAAGAGSAQLAGTIGLQLEMEKPAGLIAHSQPTDRKLLNGLVLSPEFHVRQTAEGRLIIGSDFAGSDPLGKGQEMAQALLARVKAMVDGSETLGLDFFTVGQRPTPADGFPLIGRPGQTEGLYIAVMHSGVTLAPLVGLLAADEIARGRRAPALDPFNPDRAPIA